MKKTILIINSNSKIIKILNDDFFNIQNHENLIGIVHSKDYETYYKCMYQCLLKNNVNNMLIHLVMNEKPFSFHINTMPLKDDHYIIIITKESIKEKNNIEDIIKSFGLQRKYTNEQFLSNKDDELNQLNDKLINIQKKYTKTNFKLRNMNIQLKSIIESIQEYLVLVNLKGEIIISNSNYRDFFKKEKNVFNFIKNNNEYLYKMIMNKEYIYLNDIKLKSHIDRYYDVKFVPIYDEEGEKKYFVITFDDVTRRMKNIRKLRNLKMAFDQSNENIAITDTNHKIIFANQAFIDEYGFNDKSDLLNMDIRNLIKKIEKTDVNKLIDREVFYNKRKNGEIFPIEISRSVVELGKEVISFVYFVKNIADRLKYEEKLIILAKKDQMTNTYTREAGIAYLNDLLSREEDTANEVSILFLDINSLKDVNDNYGHQLGDELIKEVTDAMKESTRSNDKIARLGGDEFLVILPESDFKSAEIIKKRINNDILNRNSKKDYSISVSIGIASSKEVNNNSIDRLINLADHRMYEEKKNYYKEKSIAPR